MHASRARRVLVLAVLALTLLASMVPAGVGAVTATPLPLPTSMAAVGDSISQAASTNGSLGADAPANSWSTGTNATVNSHYLRLQAAGAPISGRNHNLSVSGAKMAGLTAQMTSAVAVQPSYLTVLIGGNDVCTSTEAGMTSVADFRSQFQGAMATLTAGSPNTNIYVVSIPRVMGLYELFRNNFWARFIWSVGGVCQSLLANPTSTAQADIDRRARVGLRNLDFNAVLGEVCNATPRCVWDGLAAYGTTFNTGDVSGDYFHPSTAGQAKLASVSWNAGYSWATPAPENQPPTASFTPSCTALTCTFTNSSGDTDGNITHAWDFGDDSGSTAVSPSHTYAAADSYTVRLTVTDDDLAQASQTQTVTVALPPPVRMRIGDLSGARQAVNKNTWRAQVTILVTNTTGTAVPNATVTGGWTLGASDTCTTGTSGTCTATSDNLSRRNTASIMFTVTGATHATLAYDSAANVETSITVTRP